jgi:hypothetical protein
MARRKESRYRFDASEKKIKIPDNIRIDDILLVNNATRGIIIANQLDAGKGFTISYNPPPVTDPDFIYAIDGFTEITLDYDTSGMLDTDELNIYIEDERHGLKARPYDFGTDAIERIRVANPQSLIDADFEYGLQNTKWQSIGLNRNIPSFFEFPGPALIATDITSGGTATYSTMTVTVASGAPAAGTPISVSGTTNTLAEGLFVVLTSNGSTSFTYLAKGSIASGSIFTPYSVVKKGGVYAGSPMQVASMSGDGAGGIVTINFTFPHGLVPGSPIYVFDSTAGTQAHEGSFYVKQVVDADTVTYDAAQTVTNGTITTATISVYAKNDSFFTHRPFDGGVLMGPAIPIHGMEAKRQTKRYFRYQSGKGVFFSTGTAFCPIFDIESATYSSPDITITTQVPHAIQKGAVVKVYGINSANYNGEYPVKEIVSSTTFKVEAIVAPTDATAVLTDQPRVAVTKWIGSSIRCGLFDDTNGMFWEYDGQKLYVVRRSSTFQLAGTINVTAASELVTGTNTRFTEQLRVGDYVQIRGSRHIITTIISDTSLSISPEIRGASASNIKPTIIRELRIPQEKFNMDRIDGTDSPSGFKINLAKMQMVAIQYSWYGAGFIDFMLRGPLGEFVTVHRIPNSNINDEAFMRSGNLPARYEVVNESAISSLASTSGTSGNLELVDADRFPTPSATNPAIVMLTSNQSGTVYHELVSYTGKSGNTLTGTTRATDYTVFLDGANRTFKGSDTAYDHPSRSSAILLNNTCAPTISHWGSAVIMDGGFDDDDGYLFNLARSGTVNGSTTTTVLLFRAAPSVSDTIPGLLGEREVLNRSQIKLQELEISNNATRNIEIAAVLNPSNLGTITWSNANTTSVGSAQVFQPSFAQFNTSFATVPVDGEILFRFLSTSGTSRFDLTKIKEVQNSIVGGNNTYPDGPEVIAFIIQNNNNQSATYDLSLKWIEAQA